MSRIVSMEFRSLKCFRALSVRCCVQVDAAIHSVSSSRAAAVESRNTRSSGHGLTVNRDDVDNEGDLVSDGIVTWRRKLPDLSELGRTSSTADHHHHYHHHHQLHASKHFADTRKMSTPAAADWSTHTAAVGRRDRRDAFAQQKSFSYEAGCVGRQLPPNPDELSAAARARHDGSARSSGRTAATGYAVDRRRRLLMEAKKSYSLDDQIAPSHVAASEVTAHVYGTQPYDPPPPRDAGRLQINRETVRSAAREPAMSGERSPSGSGGAHRKLMMLHTMRAMQQDNYEMTSEQEQLQPDTHTARSGASAVKVVASTTSTAIHLVPSKPAVTVPDPPPRVPPPTSRVDRLPIARIWSRLKFDRRVITASGKK